MNTTDSVLQVNGEVFINGKELPPCPSKSNRTSSTIVGNKIYMNGYEFKDGVWKKTLAALLHNLF